MDGSGTAKVGSSLIINELPNEVHGIGIDLVFVRRLRQPRECRVNTFIEPLIDGSVL